MLVSVIRMNSRWSSSFFLSVSRANPFQFTNLSGAVHSRVTSFWPVVFPILKCVLSKAILRRPWNWFLLKCNPAAVRSPRTVPIARMKSMGCIGVNKHGRQSPPLLC